MNATKRLKDDRTIHVSTVDQTTGYHSSGMPYVEYRDVITRYSDLYGEEDIEEVDDAEWEDRMAILEQYHFAEVRHANMEPADREEVTRIFVDDADGSDAPEDILKRFVSAMDEVESPE